MENDTRARTHWVAMTGAGFVLGFVMTTRAIVSRRDQ